MNARRRSTAVLLQALAVAGTLAFAGTARATICFPAGSGVPGAPGVPKWWGGASSPGRDDPRWRGAAMFNHAGDQLKARVVVDNSGADKYLVMMWSVNADPTAGDLLYFGFYNDGATPASSTGNIFRITRKDSGYQDGGTPDGGVGATGTITETDAFYWNGTAWAVVSGIPHFPNWINDDVRMDVTCGTTACDSWDIRLRVKLVTAGGDFDSPNTGSGMQLDPTFRFWYEIKTEFGDLSSPYSSLEFNPTVIAADPDLEDPDNFADETGGIGGTPRFPATSKWMLASTDTTLSTCEKGINFDGGDISVANSITPGGNQLSLLGANTFHARPTNNTGAAISAGGILARFRIADWNTSSHASAIWRPVTSCGSATGSGADIANGSDFDLTCSWTLSAAERCDYDVPSGRPDGCPPATKDDHQCILVDLRTASSQFYFSSASAYRNHNFVGASEYRKKVRVDINGLPPFAGADPNRDVYVYIQTQNMPAQVSGGGGGKPDPTRGGEAGRSALLKRLEIPGDGRIGSAQSERIQKALAAGQITFDQVAQLMPTHVAYVWHDTGKKVKVGGAERKLLRPQSSFGYFVSHDGELAGWENKLEGATVTQIGPSFYKIAVPQNGFVNVETVIRTVEPHHCKTPFCLPYWVWILILLIIILLAFLLFRRRTPATP